MYHISCFERNWISALLEQLREMGKYNQHLQGMFWNNASCLSWPTTSEADDGSMEVEVEPSHQNCYILLPCNRRQQNMADAIIWRGSAHEAKVCHWIPPCRKKKWLAECLWGPNRVDVSKARWCVVCFSRDNSMSPPLMQTSCFFCKHDT